MSPQNATAVPVFNKQGKLVTLPESELVYAFRSGEYFPATNQEIATAQHKIALKEKYGGALGGAAAVGAGLLRGATGVSDIAARALGGEPAREALEVIKEEHPYISGGSELLGFVGGLGLTGGASGLLKGGAAAGAKVGLAEGLGTAAKLATAIPRGTMALGEAVGKGVAKVAGEGLAGKVASSVARNAVEGALFNAGSVANEEALKLHPELTAEHILPQILEGTLFGGAFGAAAPLAGRAIEKTGLATKFTRGKVAEKLEETADNLIFQSLDPTLGQFKEVGGAVGAISRGEKVAAEALGEKAAEKQGRRIMGGMVRKELEAEGLSPITATVNDYEQLAKKVKAETGPASRSIVERVDALAPEQKLPSSTLLDRLIEHSDSLKGPLGVSQEAKQFDKLVDDFVKRGGPQEREGIIKLTDLHDRRIQLDSEAYVGKFETASPEKLAKRQFANVLENFITDNLYRAEEHLGEDVAKAYFDSKKRYQMASFLEKISADAKARGEKNQRFGLGEKLMFVAGMATSPLAAIGLGIGNKIIREQGDQIAAGVIGKAAKILAVDKASQKVENEMVQAVKSFFTNKNLGGSLAVKGAPQLMFAGQTQKERQAEYDKYVAELQQRVANPDAQFAYISDKMGDLGMSAPQVTAQVVQKQIANDAYVLSKLPQGHSNTDSILPNKDKPKIPDSEIAKLARIAAVAKYGSRVLLEEMKAGHVNPETVEATKAMYRASYEALQQRVMAEATTNKHDFSFYQKQQLGTLFQVPTSNLYRKPNIKMLQNNYMTRAAAPAPARKAGGRSQRPSFYETSVGRIERL